MSEVHYRTCHLCEAMCGVAVTTRDGRVTAIRGDEEDPFSRGHICPKAVALGDIHHDPDRLRRPLKRTANGWVELDWERALDEVCARLADVQAAHGEDSVAVYQGNPTVHSHGAMLHGQAFLRALGTKSRFSATSLDQLPHMLAALEMFGHQLLLPVPDVDRTGYLLMLGANPVASNGSLMSAPGIARRLAALRARGGKLVVVDPRRTETAALADRHLPIRPGTDALFLFALIHALAADGRLALGRLGPFTEGVDEVLALAQPFSPEAVADATGIPAEHTRAVAAELGASPRAAVYGRVGLCTQAHGGVAAWLVNVLNVLTGNLDREGGVMFTRPAVDLVALASRVGQRGHFARRHTRVRGLPEFGGEWPAAALAEELETPGPGQLRALVTSAGNPVLSAPNGQRLDRALAGLELMVSIDIYLNETTRHAHYILPPTFGLERSHYDLAFHALAVRNTAKWSGALFARGDEQRHDWEIFLGLATRLAARGGLARRLRPLADPLLARLDPDRIVDLALRAGPYRLSLAQLRARPHGLDLGPLEPCLPARLHTPSRTIRLAPSVFVADLPRLRATLARAGEEGRAPELVLIGRRELRSNNSWMHNVQRLMKGRARCTLEMHPRDAAARGLSARDGEEVTLTTRTGEVRAKLELTEAVMPGVVALPHGYGHHRPGVRLGVAAAHPGVSANDLTDEAHVDGLTGTAGFSGVPVEVR